MNKQLSETLDSVKRLQEQLQAGREPAEQVAYEKHTTDDARRLRLVVESWDVEVNEDVIAGMLAAIVYQRAGIASLPVPVAHAVTALLAGFGACVTELSEEAAGTP